MTERFYAAPIERPLPLKRARWVEPSILPGFGLSMGLVIVYLSLVVLIPLGALAVRPWEGGLEGVVKTLTDPRVAASLRLSFGLSFLAALTNAPLGLLVAWTLTRYEFPGRRFLDALVDLPFALPTAVAGIALTALYAENGPVGGLFAPLGLPIAYRPAGVVVALVFIGLPFIVRTVEPVLAQVSKETEEAAVTLGATRLQTFRRVILPAILPALATGFALAFARGAGEYGSVIFIAGNMPYVSEIAPLLIVTQLEEYDYAGAAAIAVVMLVVSFLVLLALNALQFWQRRRSA
jgi:sulfate transport system permease protein